MKSFIDLYRLRSKSRITKTIDVKKRTMRLDDSLKSYHKTFDYDVGQVTF